jgi:putative oxidoreductase
MKGERILELVLRIALGELFICSGGLKLLDLEQFALNVHQFELTPWDLSMVIAMFLPWLEIVTGVALIVRRLYAGAIGLCALMAIVFIIAISSAWARGLDLTCGCFGSANNQTNYPLHLALNGAMLAATVGLAHLQRRCSAREAAASEPPNQPASNSSTSST